MKLKQWVAGAALACGMVGGASAALQISVDGPDNSTDIDISFTYLTQPGTPPFLSTLSLSFAGGLVLDDGSRSNPGFTYLGATGLNTSTTTLSFSGWGEGETLTLFNLDLDPGSPRVDALIGSIITATYVGGATESYRLVDDTGPGSSDRNGLRAESYTPPAQVPVPATAFLLGAGLLGLGVLGRRR